MQNVFTAHKQIERTLRYLAIIAQQAKEGIAVFDLDGSIQFVNEVWVQMHGYETKDKLIGKQLRLFHTKEQMKTDVTPFLEETKHCGQLERTVEHVRSDGTVFSAQTKMILVRDEAGKATELIVFAADTGQREKLQETTAENLKRVKQLSQRITKLRKLFGECMETGQYLAEQTGELQANNEILQQQMADLDQSPQRPEQYPEQIVNRKVKVVPKNQRTEGTNHEHRQYKETPAESYDEMIQSKSLRKMLNTKELVEVAELARRLSERT